MQTAWRILKRTIQGFIADDALSLGGALAFYTVLSMAPLLVLVLAIAGFVWQESQVRDEIVRRLVAVMGPAGAEAVAALMRDAVQGNALSAATVIGFVTLLFSATGAFAQLQYSLNRVWNVEARAGRDVADFLRRRALSLLMILIIALLLIASLVASTALSFVSAWTRDVLPGAQWWWSALNYVGSFVVFAAVFTLIHHSLPDVVMPWKDSLVGGTVTALLFVLGKEVLGWYLGSRSVASAYGAASSLFIVLLWVYYSSLILFGGAELTQAFAEEMGHEVVPNEYAQRAPVPPSPA